MADEFQWDGDEDVVYRSVPGIAVYRNEMGLIVIRQEKTSFQDEDPFVMVPEVQLPKLIDALKKQLA